MAVLVELIETVVCLDTRTICINNLELLNGGKIAVVQLGLPFPLRQSTSGPCQSRQEILFKTVVTPTVNAPATRKNETEVDSRRPGEMVDHTSETPLKDIEEPGLPSS